jgi:hypothetical protein
LCMSKLNKATYLFNIGPSVAVCCIKHINHAGAPHMYIHERYSFPCTLPGKRTVLITNVTADTVQHILHRPPPIYAPGWCCAALCMTHTRSSRIGGMVANLAVQANRQQVGKSQQAASRQKAKPAAQLCIYLKKNVHCNLARLGCHLPLTTWTASYLGD